MGKVTVDKNEIAAMIITWSTKRDILWELQDSAQSSSQEEHEARDAHLVDLELLLKELGDLWKKLS